MDFLKTVFLKFPLVAKGNDDILPGRTMDQPGEALLIWTTTPWTLTSNVAAAVGPDLTYVKVHQKEDGWIYYLAKDAMANALIGESLIQLVDSDLGVFELRIGLADLYLDAGANAKAQVVLQEVLRLYPGNAHAKLIFATSLAAENESDRASELLREIASTYASADEDFLYLRKMRELADELSGDAGS